MEVTLYVYTVLIYCVYSLNSSIYYLFILLTTLRALLKNSYALVLDVLVQPVNKLQTHLKWPPSIIKCCILHIQLQTNHCFICILQEFGNRNMSKKPQLHSLLYNFISQFKNIIVTPCLLVGYK